jgi:paired box protein 1/9
VPHQGVAAVASKLPGACAPSPPPGPHCIAPPRGPAGHCWPSSHSVSDILANAHHHAAAAAAAAGFRTAGQHTAVPPAVGQVAVTPDPTGAAQNYNYNYYHMYLQSCNTTPTAVHNSAALAVMNSHHSLSSQATTL